MIQLLGMLYMALVASEAKAKPKRGWRHGLGRRKKADSLPTFVVSDWKLLPAKKTPAEEVQASTPNILSEKRANGPIPETLVEKERAAALRLQMPEIPNMGDWVYLESAPERFDTPIARTLTEDLLKYRPGHVPSVALRHIPVNDAARDMLGRRACGSHGSSPRRAHTPGPQEPKGRPTPKRPRKGHRANQGH